MKGERIIPMLPLRDIVIFPHMVVPLLVGRKRSVTALEEAMSKDKKLFLVAQKDARIQEPEEKDIYTVGTIGSVCQLFRLPDGTVKAVLEGGERASLVEDLSTKELFLVRVQEMEELEGNPAAVEALMRSTRDALEQWVRLIRKTPIDMGLSLDDPGKLADTVVADLDLKLSDKQNILETRDKQERLEKVFRLLKSEIEILGLQRKIHTRVREQIIEGQKEYFLNEQMRAIQKELGEKDEFKSEIDELEARRRKKTMSKEAHEKVKKEIKRLSTMSPTSPEGPVVRN